jgi:hypothetical protein
MDYKISKEHKEVFTAQRRGDKSIMTYEFEKKNHGWYVQRTHYDIDAAFPKVDDMFLPGEVVEQILLIESTKNKLTEGE